MAGEQGETGGQLPLGEQIIAQMEAAQEVLRELSDWQEHAEEELAAAREEYGEELGSFVLGHLHAGVTEFMTAEWPASFSVAANRLSEAKYTADLLDGYRDQFVQTKEEAIEQALAGKTIVARSTTGFGFPVMVDPETSSSDPNSPQEVTGKIYDCDIQNGTIRLTDATTAMYVIDILTFGEGEEGLKQGLAVRAATLDVSE